jgi:GNAT superfamily N-acetyltransferase
MRAPASCGVVVVPGEMLDVERGMPSPGSAVCVGSGSRLAWRRVLAVRDGQALLRADVAPFADGWFEDIVGCVRPRLLDHVATLAPARLSELGWGVSMVGAHAFATYKRMRLRHPGASKFTARPLSIGDWPRVRSFWLRACGKPLQLTAQPSQHVVGLFSPAGALAGVNIQIVLGDVSYAAYTLVDRRCRGLGGGRKMIEAALGVARELGVKLVYVHIHARNVPSIAAYEASGFHFARWWTEESDPLLAAERQWRVYERTL